MERTITSPPPFPYFGGKSKVLPWIYELMPSKINHLVDVFGGAGSVVLGCKAAQIRTYNDINGDLVNFMRVLRESADDLITLIELTPHSREEYINSFDEGVFSDIERARRTFVRITQSFGRTLVKSGWSGTINHGRYGLSESTIKVVGRVKYLSEVVQALRYIQIDNLDAMELIDRYKSPNVYFFVDPPYLSVTRSGSVKYASDGLDSEYHINLINTLKALDCAGWMICTYANDLYSKALDGYPIHSKQVTCNGKSNPQRTEVIYTSKQGSCLTLFS